MNECQRVHEIRVLFCIAFYKDSNMLYIGGYRLFATLLRLEYILLTTPTWC